MLIGTVNSSLSNVGEDRRFWRTIGKSAPIEDHASLGEGERDQIWSDLKRERNGNKKLENQYVGLYRYGLCRERVW
jgi:hypothetical protein